MKIRSLSELEDALDNESGWRKKELVEIRLHVRGVGEPAQRGLRRAAFALTYAHWEGFTKQALVLYLTYVRTKSVPAFRLNDAFAALALGRSMKQYSHMPKEGVLPAALGEFRSDRSNTLPSDDLVRAGGNLHSEQLRAMLMMFGLEDQDYVTRFNWLDATLVKGRNEIAHGRETAPKLEDFIDAVEEVLKLIDLVHTQISNAAALQLYERPTA